mgnify:CR=1 FL=1
MKIEIKLYSYHDMDLVSLYKTGQVLFPETTRQVLNAYANKEVYRIKLLKTDYNKMKKHTKDNYKKYYHYYVVLDEKEDIAAIQLLQKISPGYRTNFVKSVLRQYLCGVFLSAYSVDKNPKIFREMANLFQGNRELMEQKKKMADRSKSSHKAKIHSTENDVCVKQMKAKTCDAEPAEFHTPTHASNHISADGQLSNKEPDCTKYKTNKNFKSDSDNSRKSSVLPGVKSLTTDLATETAEQQQNLSVEHNMQAIVSDTTHPESETLTDAADSKDSSFDDFLDQTTEQY